MNVMPTSCWIRLSSSCIFLRSFRSRAPSGSSSSSTLGWLTRARASATRCCWPPDICGGLRVSNPIRSTRFIASFTRVSISSLPHLLASQPERHVLVDVQVREQRVGLEHGVDVALVGGVVGDVATAQVDRAERRILEAADHPERGGLAAPRRAQHAEELALGDIEGKVVHRGHVSEQLGDTFEAYVDLGHVPNPLCRRPRRAMFPRSGGDYHPIGGHFEQPSAGTFPHAVIRNGATWGSRRCSWRVHEHASHCPRGASGASVGDDPFPLPRRPRGGGRAVTRNSDARADQDHAHDEAAVDETDGQRAGRDAGALHRYISSTAWR